MGLHHEMRSHKSPRRSNVTEHTFLFMMASKVLKFWAPGIKRSPPLEVMIPFPSKLWDRYRQRRSKPVTYSRLQKKHIWISPQNPKPYEIARDSSLNFTIRFLGFCTLHGDHGCFLRQTFLIESSSSTIWCPNSSMQFERQRCNARRDHFWNQSEAIQGSWIHQCRVWTNVTMIMEDELGFGVCLDLRTHHSISANKRFICQCNYPCETSRKSEFSHNEIKLTNPSDCSKTECKCNTCGGVGVKP